MAGYSEEVESSDVVADGITKVHCRVRGEGDPLGFGNPNWQVVKGR